MNVLLLHSSSDEYGASKILLGTVRLLLQKNHRVLVVLSAEGPLVRTVENAGARVIIQPLGILRRKYFNISGFFNRLLTLTRAVKKLQALMRKEAIELVISNTTGVLAGAFAANKIGVRHIWHVHEIIEHPRWMKKIIGYLLNRYASGIIAVSEAVKNCWQSVVTADKITVIHNGIDYSPYLESTASLREELHLPTDALVIGMVGRVHYWKGQSYFLTIAGKLHREFPQLRFLMAGDAFPGYEYLYEELAEQIKELELGAVVHQLGFRKDIPAVMQTIDLLILPSQQPDPFPTVILEAMASAQPVIATQFGGAVEMIEQGVTGDFIPPDDAEQAVAVIRNWLDSSRLESAGKAGRVRVLEKFSLRNWEEKMIKCLQ
jgi:glycosyltransferase involved in cell wall biosynthesis